MVEQLPFDLRPLLLMFAMRVFGVDEKYKWLGLIASLGILFSCLKESEICCCSVYTQYTQYQFNLKKLCIIFQFLVRFVTELKVDKNKNGTILCQASLFMYLMNNSTFYFSVICVLDLSRSACIQLGSWKDFQYQMNGGRQGRSCARNRV